MDVPADTAAAPTIPPAAAVPPSLADETGYLLRRGYVRAGEWMRSALPPEVPGNQYEILQALSDLGPRSQHELGELLRVNRTIMVKLIDALEEPGLVQRRRNAQDRRAYSLQLTPAGRHTLSAVTPAVERAEAGLTAGLTDAERARLQALLRRTGSSGRGDVALPPTLARRAAFLLTPAHFQIREAVDERLRGLGLTTALYGTLATIALAEPQSQRAIADQLGLTGPAVVQNIDRLQAAGLVERRRDPADRRSNAVAPTVHGRQALAQARRAIHGVNRRLDDTLGGAEHRRELNRLLRRLLEPRAG
jgi:DNA-binding MarR family transcriptional regulator